MRLRADRVLVAALLISGGVALSQSATRSVTLSPPFDPITKKYDEGRACYSFKLGARRDSANGNCDLGYGFLSISDQDWFTASIAGESRNAIKDLGGLRWEQAFTVPALKPQGGFPGARQITVDASADTHKHWAKGTQNFAKVAVGHIYALRVKNRSDDFYVLFRVEAFEQKKYCTISWWQLPAGSAPKDAE